MIPFLKLSLEEARELADERIFANFKKSTDEKDWHVQGYPRWTSPASAKGEVVKNNHEKLRRAPRRLHSTATGKVELINVIREGQSYATVSHVWADSVEKEWDVVACEIGQQLGVDYLWVDKTCIDQQNEDEKAEEIPKMAQYYIEADLNVIVLSEMHMAAVINTWISQGRPVDSSTPSYRAALQKLSQLLGHCLRDRKFDGRDAYTGNQYFERVWTMQEFELARYHVVLAADGLVDGEDLDILLRSRGEQAIQVTVRHWHNIGDLSRTTVHFFNNLLFRADVDDEAWADKMRRPLVDVWKLAEGRKCKDPRDILWGVLSLVKGGGKVKARYSEPLQEVVGELLEKESNLGDILAVKSSKVAGMIPGWCAWPNIAGALRFPSSLSDGNIEIGAFELSLSESDGKIRFVFVENEQVVDCPPRDSSHDQPLIRRAQRYWGVPLWSRNSNHTRGVILADGNSEGIEVYKLESLCLFHMGRPESVGSMTMIQISGWADAFSFPPPV